ncbi:MAG: TraB/GumN family protein [Bacteroidetes bacterium]|nr:MAG: TraB/GumN family protein [Bacteroidota bacterium]
MKYLFAFLLAYSLQFYFAENSYSQTSNPDGALLWEISGNGLSQPSYLYGTIHMVCASDFKISNTLKEKFSSASKIYLELDMDEPGIDMKMLQLSIMKDRKLNQIFNEKDYAKLNDYFRDSVGMPLTLFQGMKPFVLLSMISMKAMPCENQESYELNFVKMSKAQHKEMLGLETMEDQIKVFDDMPDSVQVQMVMSAINEVDEQRVEFAKMTNYYVHQNLDSLYRLIVNSPDIAGSEDALLYNRNRNWIPVMKNAMKSGPIFFAVGAGHLGGPKGVINLLKAEGFTVKAVAQN